MRIKMLLILFLMMPLVSWGQTTGQVTGFDCRLLVDGQVMEQTALASTGGTIIWNTDVHAFPVGLHRVTAQVVCNNTDGVSTSQFDSFFYRVATGTELYNRQLMAEIYIDGSLFKQEALTVDDGISEWLLGMNDLPDGLHSIKILVTDETTQGTATSCYNSFFYRVATGTELYNRQLMAEIYIDGSLFKQEALTVDDGISEWLLGMNDLPDGLHSIKILVTDETTQGTATSCYNSFFYRVPNPTDNLGFVGYDYWVNEEHQGHADITPHQTVYMLDSVLTVDEKAFRSTSFHFAVEDDVPVVYAQNDLWVMFLDVSGKAANAYGSYYDTRTRQEVTDLTLLRPGETTWMYRPTNNVIKWFKVEALTGDSVFFKTDQACTWHLFSPSGEELYRADDALATEWGGTLAPEDGTYYVAVHDMTVSGNWLYISYKHVDGQFALDDTDWAILQSFYAQYGTGNFVWDMTDRHNVRGMEGVSIALGHVVEIRLPNLGLQGAFPTMLLGLEDLRLLDLGQNALSGNIAEDIAQYCAQNNSLSSRVQELYLANNEFSGNVGALASLFADLTLLDVNCNCFSEVSPVVPSSVALGIQYQNLPPLNADISHGMDAFVASIPPICYYNHHTQSQSNTLQTQMQLVDSVMNPVWSMNHYINNGTCTPNGSSSTASVYRGVNGQDIYVFTFMSGSWTNYQLFNAVFRFATGDANVNGEVDIDDLQTMINRIFSTFNNTSNTTAINFTACNHYPDDILNVQDVVGQVNLLLSANPVAPNGCLLRLPVQDDQSLLASLYWSDGVLYLNSPVPVAALDIINAVGGKIHWNVEQLGMIVSTASTAQGEHAVIYSLGGALIPAGVTPLATTASSLQDIVYARLTDEDAQGIPVRLNASTNTGIQENFIDEVICRWEDGNLNIYCGELFNDVNVTVYSIDGRVVYETHLPQVEGVTCVGCLHGIIEKGSCYIVVLRSSGQVIARQKLTQTR